MNKQVLWQRWSHGLESRSRSRTSVPIATMLANEPIDCDDGHMNNHFDRDDNRQWDREEARKQASLNATRVAMNYGMFDHDEDRDEL